MSDSKIIPLYHLGLFLSLIPESPLRKTLFEHRCTPTRITGIRKDQINDQVEFQFRFQENGRSRGEQSFVVVWDTVEGTLKYYLSKRTGRSSSSNKRHLNDMTWFIEIRTLLDHGGWECVRSRIKFLDSYIENNFDDFLQRFETAEE
jgi:hypothetical protein